MRIFFFNLILLVFLFSCNSESKSVSSSETSEQKASTGNSCLVKFADEPCTIFTTAEISKFSGIPESDIEMEAPHPIIKSASMKSCSYNWPSNRTQTISILNVTSEVAVKNLIGVGMIKILTEEELDKYKQTRTEYFTLRYKSMTDAEVAEVKEKVNEELDKNEKTANSEPAKKVSESLIGQMLKSNYEAISGVGDLASWETNMKRSAEGILHVLHEDVIFKVIINISDESSVNLEMAKKVALTMLAKCN